MEYLIFTCPECGSHELLRADRCLAYRKDRSIIRKDGKYLPGESELLSLEPRGLAGLQCAKCMYPDSCRTSFRWKSWKYLEAHGCLSADPNRGREEVACTVCSLDGHLYRTYAMLKPGEQLSGKERRDILKRVLQDAPGIVICERDKVEELPRTTVKRQKALQ